mmetsp:Transcript_96641/g.171870  ORF Transcript_96641/g.171870 Transcript_96641/m.171870 type:complete len:412 (+) Transcript_96641:51-1286(+)|eukprot:CAMPEP_0197654166 /NCGR_PEP_ID=MMETSP1338-20131121/38691_1 /TAXON_ID=43686 ORGANISM="Pelagodinium beii, Strain RCC1491" /NCGR_SAMPLE_ID=MMETSP1338 /ASSEMBLY_ACC=CAM_ASM_000754 /LENGTH=411 /DNA_ID=CAMNT_0043229565 /DNA_START=45 /DNA_END=1280 /DNA_ORIENTATION=+
MKKSKPMDLLKSALAERQAKAQKTMAETGSKWVKRSELESKRVEEYFADKKREEERQQADEEARMAKLSAHFTKIGAKEEEQQKSLPAHLLDEALLDDDAEPPIAVEEIVNRFREMGMPIVLFGETDMQRYKRMRQLEREDHEGKKNPDLVALENLHANARTALEDEVGDDGEDQEKKKENSDSDASESEGEKNSEKDSEKDSDKDSEATGETLEGQGGEQGGEGGEAPKEKKEEDVECPDVDVGLMDKCDFVRAWVRKTLKAWEKELADLPDEEKKMAKTKAAVAAHRQVRRDVRPLQKRLRMYVMQDWLLDKIYPIIKNADDREYRSAAEAYLDLTIGKAAWPVGIGCGGSMLMEDAIELNDKFNRMANVKDIAFALNDEVTRKFVQALKRLMNCAQKYWPPTDCSKTA